jgi:hypothetical protein
LVWLKLKRKKEESPFISCFILKLKKFNQKIKMNIFLTLVLCLIINQVCINGSITLSFNKTPNYLQLIENEHDTNDLISRKSLNSKRGFFGTHNLFDIRLRSLAGELKQYQKAQ